jgi:diguanylate cyclase (GGDEF)-like protein
MRLRNLLQPSFRNRLRLFFVVIVIVPMIAVGLVVYRLAESSGQGQTDAQLNRAQIVANNLYWMSSTRANAAGKQIVQDPALLRAIAERNPTAIESRLADAARAAGVRQVLLRLTGQGRFSFGAEPGIAPADNALEDPNGAPVGRLVTAVDTAPSFVATFARTTAVGAVIEQGDEVLASSSPEMGRARLTGSESGTVAGREHRFQDFKVDGFDGGDLTMRIALPEAGNSTLDSGLLWIILGTLVAFLILAVAFAITVSRTLQSEVQRLLKAARQIGAGRFDVDVPTGGNDEFAALGTEFTSMAAQLKSRLEELQRERARLQEAIRRVGESFTKSLDRVGLLEIVVQTAVDGVEASCGRATIRGEGETKLREVARTGDARAYQRALQAAEAAALDAGQLTEIDLAGAHALAAPLGEAGQAPVGVVSVARGERFTSSETELFSSLTNQASMSVENVGLHETVQRQAVTDELTGLFNHRRFQEVMTQEVERARRYDQEMGLIMLDIDNFKRVNDTYGHMQGDMVLREVARVLRQSSREIDEPARYGGEEMAVALPQTDLDGAYRFAERVRSRIEALDLPLLEGDGTLKVTASFGAASLNRSSGDGKDALVAAADAALYRAKRSGKNRTVRAE